MATSGGPGCSFAVTAAQTGANGMKVPVGNVTVTVITAAEFANCNLSTAFQGGYSLRIDIPGADEAFADYGFASSTVCARRDGTNFIVYVPSYGSDNNPPERAIAEAVAAHLQ